VRTPQTIRVLDEALDEIAAGAELLDQRAHFPTEAFSALRTAGVLTATLGTTLSDSGIETVWGLVRRISKADASVGRILDGHLNAVERLELVCEAGNSAAADELALVAAEEHLLGVWGADPPLGEGTPARIKELGGRPVVRGAKVLCSGAGGVQAALVMVGNDEGAPPSLVLVQCDERLEIDRTWYRATGLRGSESHLVHFDDAPAAPIGAPGELGREPWFSRDAMRTAAGWAGMIDSAGESALDYLASRRRTDDALAALAAGRIEAVRGTVDAWLAKAAEAVNHGVPLKTLSIQMRVEIERAARVVLQEAASACGSEPFVTGGRLDLARRDLETFLLQHRLTPLLAQAGAEELKRR
jgi:hypothetical protein